MLRAVLGIVLLAATASQAVGADFLWLEAPFIRQQKEGCGSASLAMVIRYWIRQRPELKQQDADPVQIQQRLQSPDTRGLHASSLIRYLEDHGFDAFAFAGEWKDLEHHIAQGRPLIVCLGDGRDRPLHYLVVVGAGKDKVAVNDPAGTKLAFMDRREFERRWAGAGHWTLLAVPGTAR